MSDDSGKSAAFGQLLLRTRRRLLAVGAARGVCSVAAGAAAALLVVFAGDRLAAFPPILRAVIGGAFVVLAVAFFYARVLTYFLRPPNVTDAARALERARPGFEGFALSAAELRFAPGSRSSAPSGDFVDMAVDEAIGRAQGATPSQAVPLAVLVRTAAAAGAVAAVWALIVWLAPGDAAAFVRRMSDPFGMAGYPARTRIVAVDAPAVIPRGGSFRASITVEGVLPDEAVFHIVRSNAPEECACAPGINGRYECSIEKVGADFSFFVDAGDARSEKTGVRVIDRPAVISLRALVAYPSYTNVGNVTLSGGNIAALRGSRVNLVAELNKPVKAAALAFGSGAQVTGAAEPAACSAQFVFDVADSDDYRVALVDEYGFESADAARYHITPQPDAAPVVTLLKPARDLTVVPDATLPVEVKAADDYGLSGISLVFEVTRAGDTRRGEAALAFQAETPRSGAASSKWELSALGVIPGDVITYYAKAADNLPGAPQEGQSVKRIARVVSVAEKIAEMNRINGRVQAAVSDAARKEEEAMRAVAAIAATREASQ